MANLSRQDEEQQRLHRHHQRLSIYIDPDCAECKRIAVKTKIDQEKAFEEYLRRPLR